MKKKSIAEQYKGLSFSDASIAIREKFKNSDIDLIQKNSMLAELIQLSKLQEKKKVVAQMQDAIKQFKCGGKLPQHANGGPLNGVPQIEDPWNSLNPNLPFIDNPFQGMMDNVVQPAYTNINPPTLPQLNSKVVAGQMPVLGQRGVTPISNTPTTIPQVNINEPNISTQPRGSGEMSAYTPALIGQGLSTALNAGILAGGYDKVAPVDNPYESQVKNLMASRGIDTTQQRNQILSAYNAAKDNLSNTRSANVRNALDVNMMNQTQDSLAESKLQEQVANQGFKSDYASALGSLGQQKAQAQVYSEDATARNKGNFQSNLSALGASISNDSQFFTNKKLNDVQNKLLGDILSNKYSSVGLNPEIVTRLNEGKLTPDDITKLQGTLGKEKADSLIEAFKLK